MTLLAADIIEATKYEEVDSCPPVIPGVIWPSTSSKFMPEDLGCTE